MLRVKDISFKIDKKWLLKDASLMAEPGEIWAVLGANGAGKSTLLKLIGGSLKPTDGEVTWKGKPLSEYKISKLALERAVLTQKLHLSQEFSAAEVVMLGRYPHFSNQPSPTDFWAVDNAMKQTDSEQFAPRIYQSLSGGEQQRVQFSRTLAQLDSALDTGEPKLLLLDEPLNNLDIKYQHQCLILARKFARHGHCVLVVMHDINLASFYSDKILLMRAGQVLAQGSPRDVLTEEILSKAYNFPVHVQEHPVAQCPMAFFYHQDFFPKKQSII